MLALKYYILYIGSNPHSVNLTGYIEFVFSRMRVSASSAGPEVR